MNRRRVVDRSLVLAVSIPCALLLFGATTQGVEECQYHVIQEVPLAMPFSAIEVAPGDVVYGWSGHVLWGSSDRGGTWEQIRAFPDTVDCAGLFVGGSGDVFVGVTKQGCLWKGMPGTPWSWSAPLVFTCNSCASSSDNSRMWKMCEDNSGCLFVGEYGGAWDDTCAYIHRSEDGGNTWTLVYECSSRHVHFVSADPHTSRVYASIGDGPGRYRLICSDDHGQSWHTLYSEDCLAQPTSAIFTPTTRVFGSDCGLDVNRIYISSDDESFQTRLMLGGDLDSYVWDMSKTDEGYIYAGTKAKLVGGSDVHLYASYDGGESWCGVKNFGVLPEWNGVNHISRFDSEGWAYCTYTAPGAVNSAFRFRHEPATSIADSPPRWGAAADLQVAQIGNGSGPVFHMELSDGVRHLSLKVYNLSGACVRTILDGQMPVGHHEVAWDGRSDSGCRVSRGVYFVRLCANQCVVSKKAVLWPGP